MVGVTIIGGTVYSIAFYRKFYGELMRPGKEAE
jgi:hypothetical protein